MGRRKKVSQSPIKMVIGRSPEQNKGQDNANYAILTQSAATDSGNRSRRKSNNADCKKLKEQESDDDDLEIVQVYKPPASHRQRLKAASQNQNQPSNRPPLVMVCIDEELSTSQKQAIRQAQMDYDTAKQKINTLKRRTNYKEYILDSYTSPELINLEEIERLGGNKCDSKRSSSPDVMIIEQPTVVKNKMTTAAVPAQTSASAPVTSIAQNVPEVSKPLPMLIRSNTASQAPASTRPQDALVMGTSGMPLIIPTHFMHKGGQPILLQTNQAGCLQALGTTALNMPVLGRPMATTGSKIVPPLAPKMSVGMPNPNLPPPPPLQCMVKNGQKRPTDVKENVSQPPVKRHRGRKKMIYESSPLAIEAEDSNKANVNWVPLDEYYYSKKEGDPAYREEKGEYRFKCFCCSRMLYNNLRTMMHIQGHIDSDKQQNLDLSDLTQCKYCYKQFDTPFEMQCHVEKVHQNRSNVLVCRICEKDHASQADLKYHMNMHNACEMPYTCQLCNFRSSVYDDVVDHFKKRHDSSRYLVCLYCLKVFEIRFAKSSGWGKTHTYYQHLMKHQVKASRYKCSCCKLIFISKNEMLAHRNKDHLPNYRGTQSASSSRTVNASSEQVMICVPDSSKNKVKSLNAPTSQKQLFVGYCIFAGLNPSDLCIECKKPIITPEHFKKYTECSMCRFATICNEAFALHMYNFHVRGSKQKQTSYKENHLTKPLFCLCGYSSNRGNKIANHLVLCSKRTCYDKKPEVKWFEYDDEQEEFNPFEPYCEDESMDAEVSSVEKDVPTLFGALGLVKKSSPRSCSSYASSKESSPVREPGPSEVAQELIEDILDRMFPAEAAAEQFIGSLLANVNGEIDKLDNCRLKRMAAKKFSGSAPQCDTSESSLKPSEYKISANKQVVDPDMSSYSEPDSKHDESSVDSELPTSRAGSVTSENKGLAGGDSSNMEWMEQDANSSNTCSVNTDAEQLKAESSSGIILPDDKNSTNNMDHEHEITDVKIEQTPSASSGEQKSFEADTDEANDNCSVSEKEAATDQDMTLSKTSEQLASVAQEEEHHNSVKVERPLSENQETDLVKVESFCSDDHISEAKYEEEKQSPGNEKNGVDQCDSSSSLENVQLSSEKQKSVSVEENTSLSDGEKSMSPDHHLVSDIHEPGEVTVNQESEVSQKCELSEQPSAENEDSQLVHDEQESAVSQKCDSGEGLESESSSAASKTSLEKDKERSDLTGQVRIEISQEVEEKSNVKESEKDKEIGTKAASSETTTAKKETTAETKLKDKRGSRDHHPHNRSRYDDKQDSHRYHSARQSRDASYHYDRRRDRDRSTDDYSRSGSHAHDSSYDRDWHGPRPGRYRDYHDSRDYHGNRERYHGDRRDQRRDYRRGGNSYHGNKGYY